MSESREPRLLSPVSFLGKKGESDSNLTDFSPHPVKVTDEEEVVEVEEVLTPDPKDVSAAESAKLPETPVTPANSETLAPVNTSPTELLEAAVRASGNPSDENEDELPDQTTTTPKQKTSPNPENFPPSSSSGATSPGFPMPPAPVSPPITEKTQTP